MNMTCCVVKEEQELIQRNNPQGRYICHRFEDKTLILGNSRAQSQGIMLEHADGGCTRCSKTIDSESLASQDLAQNREPPSLLHSSTYAISFSLSAQRPSVSTWSAIIQNCLALLSFCIVLFQLPVKVLNFPLLAITILRL
jgi:hypothetical protein